MVRVLFGRNRSFVSVGQVCNLPMRRGCVIHGRLQTYPTWPVLQAFRKVAIEAVLFTLGFVILTNSAASGGECVRLWFEAEGYVA